MLPQSHHCMSPSMRLFQLGYRIATTERVWYFPVVYSRIAPKREGRAPEASNEASNESVTELFASVWIRLMSGTKRKYSGTSYTPTFGMVTSHQIRLAIEEFNRLEREGVEHGRILVAQRVPKSKI